MSLETLVGTRLAVGIPGTDATEELIHHLRRIHAHSLVVFDRNVTAPEQFVQLIQRLETTLERRLLVMVDHEGGRVIRFGAGVTRFPAAGRAGHDGPVAVEEQGRVEAQELTRLRVQVNLAPCVDVVVPGVDPVIGDRSYGADPVLVSELAVARIRGLQSHGVAACAKHFPGLGAVPRDPHKTLPTISLDGLTMEATHLPPFRAAIDAEVAMIMSSHVCYPRLGDPAGLPATFSANLIRNLLRRQLGFSGLILTEDLMMGALRSFGTIGQAAVRATQAGHDLLLICDDLLAQQEAFSRLQSAYHEGLLDLQELEASASRIDQLRRKLFKTS
jgi:beta-N-acetylhexosaminidase